MAPMTDFQRERVRAWLKECRGATSQAALAEDITNVTNWTITRDRYSKYESGAENVGPSVLRRFVGYWAKKGKPGPDFTPPVVAAPPDLATALLALAEELRETRKERTALTERVERMQAILDVLAPPAMRDAGALVARDRSAGSAP